MTFLVLILAMFMRRRGFFQRMGLINVPRDEEDPTKCCNAGTGSARRRNEINRVLEEELENLMDRRNDKSK